ncbi:hypothetical protein TNCV_940771 [Trichonephila clavipes]|nr:hypothetical protein TNCV_940771 [Trichonephila clavipes]
MLAPFSNEKCHEKDSYDGFVRKDSACTEISELVNDKMRIIARERKLSYTRAFGDGPRNFEPWSSDEYDNRAGTTHLLSTTPQQQEDV